MMSGYDRVQTGSIYLAGKSIDRYSKKQLAKLVAVLQQEALPSLTFTVREVIEMGRFPYQNWLGEDEVDVDALIDDILTKMNLLSYANQPLDELSGGERQRVALAKIMAQDPQLLMLDEPTTYLDIGYQLFLMDSIKAWQREADMTVIAVLHDLNLAAMYCDRLLLLKRGEIVAIGTPEQIITEEAIEYVYGVRPIIMEHPILHCPQIVLNGYEEQSDLLSIIKQEPFVYVQ